MIIQNNSIGSRFIASRYLSLRSQPTNVSEEIKPLPVGKSLPNTPPSNYEGVDDEKLGKLYHLDHAEFFYKFYCREFFKGLAKKRNIPKEALPKISLVKTSGHGFKESSHLFEINPTIICADDIGHEFQHFNSSRLVRSLAYHYPKIFLTAIKEEIIDKVGKDHYVWCSNGSIEKIKDCDWFKFHNSSTQWCLRPSLPREIVLKLKSAIQNQIDSLPVEMEVFSPKGFSLLLNSVYSLSKETAKKLAGELTLPEINYFSTKEKAIEVLEKYIICEHNRYICFADKNIIGMKEGNLKAYYINQMSTGYIKKAIEATKNGIQAFDGNAGPHFNSEYFSAIEESYARMQGDIEVVRGLANKYPKLMETYRQRPNKNKSIYEQPFYFMLKLRFQKGGKTFINSLHNIRFYSCLATGLKVAKDYEKTKDSKLIPILQDAQSEMKKLKGFTLLFLCMTEKDLALSALKLRTKDALSS